MKTEMDSRDVRDIVIAMSFTVISCFAFGVFLGWAIWGQV